MIRMIATGTRRPPPMLQSCSEPAHAASSDPGQCPAERTRRRRCGAWLQLAARCSASSPPDAVSTERSSVCGQQRITVVVATFHSTGRMLIRRSRKAVGPDWESLWPIRCVESIYHPDPVRTGAVTASDVPCISCGRARGYIYVGPVSADEDLADRICPWCIADGTAHEQFRAEFIDPEGVGGYGTWESVPVSVVRRLVERTPGFSGWQQERWFTCCGDEDPT